jgi:uncharacterized membrane protein
MFEQAKALSRFVIPARVYRTLLLVLSVGVILTAIALPQPALAQMEKDFTLFLTRHLDRAEPGEDNILFLEIRNTGRTELTSIEFSSLAPEDWIVEFDPATISSLSTDSFQTVEVKVRPPTTASKGRYEFTLIAETDGTRRITSTWLRVETPTSIWLWTGIAIAAVVVAAFIFVFVHLGRQ